MKLCYERDGSEVKSNTPVVIGSAERKRCADEEGGGDAGWARGLEEMWDGKTWIYGLFLIDLYYIRWA
jgi:hypothetical protein